MKIIGTLIILLNLVCNANAQINIYADSSLSHVLKLNWEIEYEKNDLSIYGKKPLTVNDLVIGHFNMDFVLDLESGNTLKFNDPKDQDIIRNKISDSLIYYHLLDKVIIKNIYNGDHVFFKKKQKGYQIEWKTPMPIVSEIVHFKQKNNYLIAYNYLNNSQVWQIEFPEMIYAFDYYMKDKINLTTKTKFYQISRQSGDILWSIPIVKDGISSLNTELNFNEGKLFLWAESSGLNVLNLETHEIESIWLKGQVNAKFTMQMIFKGDSIFARTPMNIYCISKTTGKVYWKSKDIRIRSDLTLCNDFIFFYQRGKENDVDVLTAFNIATQKVKYAQFTSESYPPKNINEGIYKNQLDLTVINFQRGLHQNKYLIGSDINSIYCFELIE